MTSPSQRRALLSMFSAQPHHLAEIGRYAYLVEYVAPEIFAAPVERYARLQDYLRAARPLDG